MQMALEQSPVSIVITDRAGSIEYVNPKFTESTGYCLAEALGRNSRFLNTGQTPAGLYRQLWETISRGDAWQGELLNQKKNGESFWESVRIAPLKSPAGEITHYLAVKEDITERKATERELRRARDAAEAANRLTGAFLAEVSRELSTPMNGVISWAELLRDCELTGEQTQYVQALNSAVESLSGVIDAIPHFPGIEAGALPERASLCASPGHPLQAGSAAQAELFDRKETLARMDGDWELFREVAGLFATSSREMMAEIGSALGTKDPKRVERAAHALKGTIANFGARASQELALKLEELGKSGTLAGAREQFAALETELERLREALKRAAGRMDG